MQTLESQIFALLSRASRKLAGFSRYLLLYLTIFLVLGFSAAYAELVAVYTAKPITLRDPATKKDITVKAHETLLYGDVRLGDPQHGPFEVRYKGKTYYCYRTMAENDCRPITSGTTNPLPAQDTKSNSVTANAQNTDKPLGRTIKEATPVAQKSVPPVGGKNAVEGQDNLSTNVALRKPSYPSPNVGRQISNFTFLDAIQSREEKVLWAKDLDKLFLEYYAKCRDPRYGKDPRQCIKIENLVSRKNLLSPEKTHYKMAAALDDYIEFWTQYWNNTFQEEKKRRQKRGLKGYTRMPGLSPNLVKALIMTESGFNPAERNKKTGALGIGQILPKTLASLKKTGKSAEVKAHRIDVGGDKIVPQYGADWAEQVRVAGRNVAVTVRWLFHKWYLADYVDRYELTTWDDCIVRAYKSYNLPQAVVTRKDQEMQTAYYQALNKLRGYAVQLGEKFPVKF